jgi:hypothetical protein
MQGRAKDESYPVARGWRSIESPERSYRVVTGLSFACNPDPETAIAQGYITPLIYL